MVNFWLINVLLLSSHDYSLILCINEVQRKGYAFISVRVTMSVNKYWFRLINALLALGLGDHLG